MQGFELKHQSEVKYVRRWYERLKLNHAVYYTIHNSPWLILM